MIYFKNNKEILLFLIIFLALIVGSFLSIIVGQVYIPLKSIFNFIFHHNINENHYLILKMRFFRLSIAFISGVGLAVSGVIYQSALKNPLADPFMLGVSSGAALFSALAITLKLNTMFYISTFAFFGALLAVIIVMLMSVLLKFSISNLILAGVAINSFFSSVLTVIMYISKDMQNIFFWLMGSLIVKNHFQIALTYLIVIVILIYLIMNSTKLDILRLNDKTIFSLGINQIKEKIKFLSLSSIISAIIVSQTGIIGFVGLITPHIARILIGDLHQKLILFSALFGGTILVYCDIFSRLIISYSDIPIGVMTSLIGTPFFIFILINHYKNIKDS